MLFARPMGSLPQMFTTLGACTCMSSNKIINARPCIAQFNNNKRSTHFIKGTLFPFALVGQKKPMIELRKQCQNGKWKARAEENPGIVPHADIESIVNEFYDALNGKDIEKLKHLVSDEIEYQDYLFYNPYIGREHVIGFWKELMDALGPHIKIVLGVGDIRVEDVPVEDVEAKNVKESLPMATVFWHLEWGEGDNKKKLPFTKGCRFFWFKEDEKTERLIIRKVTGLEEFPLKPGELLLNVLKAIHTFLDSYPTIASALLNTPAFQDD